jgi:hypothetical protein
LCLAAALVAAPSPAANEPNLLWQTIQSKHFRITYYSGEGEAARHLADMAEDIYDSLGPVLGTQPRDRIEIVLTDQTDSANGSASALPYNAMRLYLTAPEDMSPLGDVDDWYRELFAHELTHVFHTDHIRGLPAIVNAVLGKTMAPNQVQPRWMLEGLAVTQESGRTTGGRLRSSQWKMWMRTEVLEDNVATLDQMSNGVRRWPQGNIWYLYGSYFIQWITDTYGEDAIRRWIDDYGRQIVPWSMNRSMRRATGKTLEELYPAWVSSMQREYGAVADAVRARGVRQGTRVTLGGNTKVHPRWIPSEAWSDHAGDLLYYRDDGHATPGLYALPLSRDPAGRVTGARDRDRELLVRTTSESTASFLPDGGVVFSSADTYNSIFLFGDLHALPSGEKGPEGLEGNRRRLTRGFRAAEPDVSRDGRRVVFTTNHRGTRYLQIADLGAGELENVRALVKSDPFEQVFTPRFSPDGSHVAYSVWTKGGYRDIRYVDVRTGAHVALMHDRAIDAAPSFSPDGKWIYFHSDRTGIANIYAYEIATGRLRQVTNVVTGAFQPQVSPDGKSLAYIGYTREGYDVFVMALDESQWLDPGPVVARLPPPPEPPRREYTVEPYNPLRTIAPRKYAVQITPGNFGQALIIAIAGSDIAGHHGFALSHTTEIEKPEPQGSITYAYTRLPFDVTMSAYRSISPRGGLALGAYRPTWIQETTGVDTGIAYNMPRSFDGQSFALGYSFARTAGRIEYPIDKLDPYETPTFPLRGFVGILRLGWSYNNSQRYLWSVGPEKGFAVNANLELTDKALASEFSGYAATMNLSWYYTMPWLRHHALGLHVGGGTSGGGYPGRGAFYVGGFVDLPLLDTIRYALIQGGITLRGYPVVALAGRQYALMNAEYRFPIVNLDRGVSTFPIFLNRISGAAFVDYGSAFDDVAQAKFKTGVGGELWFDTTFGYVLGLTFRVGYARGLASGGIDKGYFVAAIPF